MNKSNLSRKMLLIIILISTFYTLLTTSYYLYLEYRHIVNELNANVDTIKDNYLQPLASSLYKMDEMQLKLELEGALNLTGIVHLLVQELGGPQYNWEVGKKKEGVQYKTHQFPLMRKALSNEEKIGILNVTTDNSWIYKQLRRKVLIILISNAIKVFFASLTIYFFIQYFVTRHLVRISNFVKDLDLTQKTPPLVIDKSNILPGKENELDQVVNSINQMVVQILDDREKQKKHEHSLQESKELYRSLVENINLGITLIDRDYTIVMANAAQGMFFHKESSQFIGKKCFQEFEKRDHVCPHCPGIEAMENGRAKETIAQGKRDDGSTFTVHIRAFPVIGADKKSQGFIEVVEDVSEQIKTQQNLASEKERLAVTLRSIGDGVITTDISGNVLLLNRVAENLTGWKNDEAVGRSLEEVFHIINERTRDLCENPVNKVLNTGQIVELANHTALLSKDGREISIADSGAPILDAQSKIIGVVLVFRDVTEQIKTERELLRMKKLESVGVLAGGIAHDFNNILAAILGNINLALFDESLQKTTRDLLSEAEKASLRAKNLTQQLLTFSKGGEPVKETSSLKNVIIESANFVLHGDKVACQYNIPEDLYLVDVDKGQISQVIQNIVINASHAMPEGGVIAISCENVSSVDKTTLSKRKGVKFVKISIQDNGIGIPKKLIDKIFDPYFSTKHEGSGLGLAICQSIISKHDGDIFVESSPTEGTTFTIYLPASGKQQQSPQEKIRDFKTANRAKILIMDDEEMVRNVAKAMLNQLGNEVILAEGGVEAVHLYKEAMNSAHPVQLVIMDLTIPGGMGGKDAVQEIHKLNPEAKVIVSSGYSNDPVMANFNNYGFCAAIVKPFQLQDLSRMLSEVLG